MYSTILEFAFPQLLRLTRSRFMQIASDIRKRQFWARGQIRSWQGQRLSELIRTARSIPFYEKRLPNLQFQNESPEKNLRLLEDLPITTKTDIQRHFPDEMVAKSSDPDWRVLGTRGTTNRLMVIHDFQRRDHCRAAQVVALTEDSIFGIGKRQVVIPPDACSVICGMEGGREKSIFRQLVKMTKNASIFDLEARSDFRGIVMDNWIDCVTVLPPFGPEGTHIPSKKLAEYIESLKTLRPVLLSALPEYLQMLARYVKKVDVSPPKIPEIRSLGANIAGSSKKELEETFGGKVREHYGSLELGGMAFDCSLCNGLHVMEDQYILETIRNGQPVDEDEVGVVVITDLFNLTMPLIRYQIGDVARVIYQSCQCGRKTKRIFLEGRLEDTFVLPSGTILTPEQVQDFFFKRSDIDQFQLLEQRLGRWELRYVPCAAGPERQELLKEISRLLECNIESIRMREVTSIIPEASGKFRHCKSSSFHKLVSGQINNIAPVG